MVFDAVLSVSFHDTVLDFVAQDPDWVSKDA
jgi:hypothetical protein